MDKIENADKAVVAVFADAADRIREIEGRGRELLHGEVPNQDGYGRLMRTKAALLVGLPGALEKMLDKIKDSGIEGPDPTLADAAGEAAADLAARAANAVKVDSVWYMGQLLYPEDHKQGDPNDIELLVFELADMAGL